MSHLIESMAYAGQAPWHTLGNALPAKQSIDTWAKAAGMDWRIRETPVRYMATEDGSGASSMFGEALEFTEQKVLYRSDTKAALSVVSLRYQVVQPRDVLEFYRDLSEVAGFELETAGVLKAGRKFWALARTGYSAKLKGSDVVNGYVLLATSCDGTLATVALPTTVRVVCNNTLSIALNGAVNAIRVPHSTVFDADAVKYKLGVAVSQWDNFMYQMKQLAERKVKHAEAEKFFIDVLGPAAKQAESAARASNERALKKVQTLYDGAGRGAELAAAKGTAWGLLSAMTEYIDHERRARSQDNRLDSAWFGLGASIKQRAVERALQLVA